jgi:hypothetical protein
MAASLVLTAIGLAGLLMDVDAFWLLVVAGVLGWATTAGRGA